MKQRLILLLGLVLMLVSPVLSQAQINYQYWIDNNKDAAVSGTTTDGAAVALSLDVADLAPGVHFYNIRARKDTEWGSVYRYLFAIPRETNAVTSQLGGYEYWLDNDYEHRTVAVATGSEQTFTPSIDVSSLAPGVHFYNMRAMDANGQWGTTYRYLFAIPREQQPEAVHMITGYRYGFGGEQTVVTFETPVSEYTLNQQFDVPAAPLPTVIDDDCHFSFSGTSATLMRNITMDFSLCFTDESSAMGAPVGTSFTLTDTRSSDIQTLALAGSLSIEAHAQGGYTVVQFDIPAADNYTLKTTATSSLRLFSSIGATLTTVGSDDLMAGYAQEYEAGTYYAVVFGNAEEVTLSLTGGSAPCGYAIFDSETGTLTFKYGVMPAGDNVWETENTSTDIADINKLWNRSWLKNVVFDPSYADARPKSTAYWFSGAENLTQIIGIEYLNTSEVTHMTQMFAMCKKLTSLDVSHFETGNVTRMGGMFTSCQSLTALDVSHFDTHNVVSFGGEKHSDGGFYSGIFTDCWSLKVLDLSSFNTEKITIMNALFAECWKLETIYVGEGWTTEYVTESDYMFRNCPKLVGGKGTKYNASYIDLAYARIDGGPSAPGYFTSLLKGDANGDGKVTITDAVAVVNYILGNASTGFVKAAADVNQDGNITITDAVGVVNIILNSGGEATAPAMASPAVEAPEVAEPE